MDAQDIKQWIVMVLLIILWFYFPAFAEPVYVYGGPFNLPIRDPPGPGGAVTEAVVQVPDHFIIIDLDVGIDITHTQVFDLQLFLHSPLSTRICLNMYDITEFFEGADYTDTIFDDEAEISIEQAQPPFTGRFRPIEPYQLSEFDSQDTFGPWLLQIYDMWPADTGTLNRFELFVTIPEPATAIVLLLNTALAAFLRPARLTST